MLKILFYLLFCISFAFANILQETIDNAPYGSTIKLPAGVYEGNIVISKPLSIVGKEPNVIIKGDNQGDVITINASDVTLKNLTITYSGDKLQDHDSAIVMQNLNNCKIINCKILESLYGINMAMVENSLFLGNYIRSKELPIRQRGDALKIWYSKNNTFKNNTIEFSRDITLNYSNNNLFRKNTFLHNRFGVHISHSDNNILENNLFQYNSVGIMLMGAKNTQVIHNNIYSSHGASGIAVVLKGVSNFLFEYNQVKYNTKGIFIDTKYNENNIQRKIRYNEISYNKEALHFHGVIKNNLITNNNFLGNIDDVVKSARGPLTGFNIIEYNYWDRYVGFDRDGDGVGDNSHKIYQYADQLWHYNNKVKFFYASPIMSLLNFLTTLAPFIDPILIIQDTKPKVTYQAF